MRGGEREMAKRGVIKGGWWRRVSSKMDGGGGFGRSGWWRRLWEKWLVEEVVGEVAGGGGCGRSGYLHFYIGGLRVIL